MVAAKIHQELLPEQNAFCKGGFVYVWSPTLLQGSLSSFCRQGRHKKEKWIYVNEKEWWLSTLEESGIVDHQR